MLVRAVLTRAVLAGARAGLAGVPLALLSLIAPRRLAHAFFSLAAAPAGRPPHPADRRVGAPSTGRPPPDVSPHRASPDKGTDADERTNGSGPPRSRPWPWWCGARLRPPGG
ncbi:MULTISPECIES: hypothetical protein [Actinosynnema]|uniref:hypothetical protein n=1 Tax=Actinosynnema TaxID=40566 RepID=UPI003557161A